MRFSFFLLFVTACSPIGEDDIFEGDATPFPFDATVNDSPFSIDDGGAEADTTPFNGGGPFLCGKCICDGTLDMCLTGTGHPAPLDLDASDDADDANADADVDDAGFPTCADASTGCVQIPIECLPKPTCDCIVPSPGKCFCTVDPSGNGLRVSCP